jgi:hypothetical protein
MKRIDIHIVIGGKLPEAALPWLAAIEKVFPGALEGVVVVRKPTSSSPRGDEAGKPNTARESLNR